MTFVPGKTFIRSESDKVENPKGPDNRGLITLKEERKSSSGNDAGANKEDVAARILIRAASVRNEGGRDCAPKCFRPRAPAENRPGAAEFRPSMALLRTGLRATEKSAPSQSQACPDQHDAAK